MKKKRAKGWIRGNNKGQSLVEFILVLPVVLLLTFGALSFGFLVYNKMIVVLAASQAADRAGEVFNDSTYTLEEKEAEVKLVANSFLDYGISKKDNDVDIYVDPDSMKNVTVEAKFNYTFMLPLIADVVGDKSEVPVSYKATYILY